MTIVFVLNHSLDTRGYTQCPVASAMGSLATKPLMTREQRAQYNSKKTWNRIQKKLEKSVSIAFDGCHKIYVNEDEEQHSKMQGYGYDPLIRIESIGVTKALETLKYWWDESCSLKFISAIKTVEGNPNDGFTDLISQA